MKQRQELQAALSRQHAPDFTITAHDEIVARRGLSLLARVLFDELLALADHATGAVWTSYAVLLSLVAVDPPARGPRPDPITLKQVRNALAELVDRRLVRTDPVKNEKTQRLFLRVQSRRGIGTSKEKQGTELGRVPNGKKPITTGPVGPSPTETGQGSGQGVQENRILSIPVVGAQVIHKGSGPIAVGDVVQGLKQQAETLRRRGNPLTRAPEGA